MNVATYYIWTDAEGIRLMMVDMLVGVDGGSTGILESFNFLSDINGQ